MAGVYLLALVGILFLTGYIIYNDGYQVEGRDYVQWARAVRLIVVVVIVAIGIFTKS